MIRVTVEVENFPSEIRVVEEDPFVPVNKDDIANAVRQTAFRAADRVGAAVRER